MNHSCRRGLISAMSAFLMLSVSASAVLAQTQTAPSVAAEKPSPAAAPLAEPVPESAPAITEEASKPVDVPSPAPAVDCKPEIKVVEKIVEKPVEKIVEKIVEKPVEKIVEKIVEKEKIVKVKECPKLGAPDKSLITDQVIAGIKSFVQSEVVWSSLRSQNQLYAGIDDSKITALDEKWKAERESAEKPLIAATLSNPLSAYLTRIQAHSIGLYTEIFAMDGRGLNAGQSSISSDYWQGDEDKFQKTFMVSSTAVFIDEPELDEELGIWKAQVNMSIEEPGTSTAIGAITVEVNLTELQRRTQPQ